MEPENILKADGSGPLRVNFGKALLTQKGGWTVGEMLLPDLGEKKENLRHEKKDPEGPAS